jgi:ankyrin repeat protein
MDSFSNLSDRDNRFLHAMAIGDVEQVKSFLSSKDKESIISAKGLLGRTPLMEAAHDGNDLMVGILIEAGADVNAIAFGGFRPIDLALLSGNQLVVDRLKKAGGISLKDDTIDYSGDRLQAIKIVTEFAEELSIKSQAKKKATEGVPEDLRHEFLKAVEEAKESVQENLRLEVLKAVEEAKWLYDGMAVAQFENPPAEVLGEAENEANQ